MLNPRKILALAPWQEVALGQKQTCAAQKAMSDLCPKADVCSAGAHELFYVRSSGTPLERISNLPRCFAADVITAAFKFSERCIS
jgi:hypothetical protein